ncbi:MBL fold metallo-hydrolase [Microbacterium karelineae]|uniref:MBL fold metallo-hydrolase n=1 Tax=Microbacterium karelineae TaxID=2654283 RepID=UPI0018D3455E|nr:MBL fold metallo-hydrolase [Microbacterium karelineae]
MHDHAPTPAGLSRRQLMKAAGVTTLAGLATAATTGAAAQPATRPTRRPRDDGATLVLLGTAGGPTVYGDRAGISSAVVVGDAFYLVDLGHGALGQVAAAQLSTSTGPAARPLSGLAGVFLTHMHSDHLSEFGSLIINGMWNGITDPSAPVPIYGPGDRGGLPPVLGDRDEPPVIAPEDPTPGTVTMTSRAIEAFAQDLNERLRGSGGVDPGAAFAPHDITLPSEIDGPVDAAPMPRIRPFLVHEDDGVRVTATLVEHSPVFPAFAFRFDTDTGSVTFSGDTAPSDNLIELAQDTDVLVHEVIDRAWAEARFPEPRTPAQEATLKHLLESHTTIEDVGPVAEAAGARALVLNHLVPGDGPVPQYRKAGRGFSGRLIVGRDLDEIPLGL